MLSKNSKKKAIVEQEDSYLSQLREEKRQKEQTLAEKRRTYSGLDRELAIQYRKFKKECKEDAREERVHGNFLKNFFLFLLILDVALLFALPYLPLDKTQNNLLLLILHIATGCLFVLAILCLCFSIIGRDTKGWIAILLTSILIGAGTVGFGLDYQKIYAYESVGTYNNETYFCEDVTINNVTGKKVYVSASQTVDVPSTIDGEAVIAFDFTKNTTNKDKEKVTIINIPDTLLTINLVNCVNLTSIDLPSSVSSLYFDNCGIKEIVIPKAVESIETTMFYNCSDLKSVIFEEGSLLKKIETLNSDGTASPVIYFSDTTKNPSLDTLVLPNNEDLTIGYSFENCAAVTNVTVPTPKAYTDCFGNYSSFWLWSTTISTPNVTILGGTKIPSNTFNKATTSLTKLVLPDTITEIETNAFNMCTFLETITYNGTMEQWNSISLEDNWKGDAINITKIACLDGDIAV